jgi:hypothetical protein
MMNIFLLDFYSRLKAWHQLKEDLKDADIESTCVEVDRFWQQVPLRARYLHVDEIDTWPDPWNLLYDNDFCLYGRALGMIYTLLLLGIKRIDFVEGIYDSYENAVLVSVDDAKYVLNGWPSSVVNTNLASFTNIKHINIEPLTKKMNK